MRKIAFVFPGQGAQYIGMGKDFYENYPISKAVIDTASSATGLDIASLCFEKNEHINQTEYTQIAMAAVEVAITAAVMEAGITPSVTAGLSLGEYGALVAADVLSAEDAFRIVRKRGIYMQEAVPQGGAMSAVIGLDCKIIESICEETEGIVSIANYNCKDQTVITGEASAVEQAGQAMKQAGARRIIPLKVSGPFHSVLLKKAGRELGKELEKAEIKNMRIPYLSNVTADYVKDKKQIRDLLMQQVYSPVKWQQSVERMLQDGVDTFIELGPGRTLTGFLKKIDRTIVGFHIENIEDFEKVLEVFNE